MGVVLAALAGTAACSKDGAPPGAGGGRGGGAGGATGVEMIDLVAAPIEQGAEFVGTIKSRRSTTVQPQVEGLITRIRVRSGARVSPGTPLVDLDATVQRAAASSLEAVRAAREADATWARQQAQRAKAMLDAGAGSQQEHEQAVAQQKAADAQLKAIEEQIRQQQAELAYFTVVAPTAGVIGDIPVREGERVTKATMLTTIDDNAGLEVYISVPVQQAVNLRVGLPVRIVDETGTTIATTSTSFVSPSVEESTQTVLVKAPIDPRTVRLRTDQFVRARIVWSTAPGLTIPVTAVTRINGQYFAFVAESGERGMVARLRPVTLGPVVNNAYVALTGLRPGDKLIVSGLQKIGDGAPVQVAAPARGAPPPGGGRGARLAPARSSDAGGA